MNARPRQDQLVLPLLTVLQETGPLTARATADAVAARIGLEPGAREERIQVGAQTYNAFDRDVRWAQQLARLRGLVERIDETRYSRWTLTPTGKRTLTPATPGIVLCLYESDDGIVLWGDAEKVESILEPSSIALICTSPPYAITTQKQYGGRLGREYEDWLVARLAAWKELLTDDGSLLLNLGDVWVNGQPTLDLVDERVLIRAVDELQLHLCERLYWHNPARLPGPAAWVTVKRIRVKPSVERIYWLSKNPFCTADNRNVLVPYSKAMQRTLQRGGTNVGERPSGHTMSAGAFATDNGGAIPGSLIEASNTSSNNAYARACREEGLPQHPATFPAALAEFGIALASRPGDVVADFFGGSLQTAAAARRLGRRFVTSDIHLEYLKGGLHRLNTERAA